MKETSWVIRNFDGCKHGRKSCLQSNTFTFYTRYQEGVFDWPWTILRHGGQSCCLQSNILRGLMRGGITFRKQVDSSGGVTKHADSSGGAMFSCFLGATQIGLGLLCSKV